MLEFLDVERLPIGPRIDRKISFEIEMLKMDQTIGIKMHQKKNGVETLKIDQINWLENDSKIKICNFLSTPKIGIKIDQINWLENDSKIKKQFPINTKKLSLKLTKN